MTLGKVLTMALMGVALTGIEAAAQVPTVWGIGDSTASNVDRRGWADPFGDYFDQGKAQTVNRAARHKSGHRGDSSAKRLESERMCTQGSGGFCGAAWQQVGRA